MPKIQCCLVAFRDRRNKLEELNLTAFLPKAAKETTAPLIQATSTLIFFTICLGGLHSGTGFRQPHNHKNVDYAILLSWKS